MTTREEALGFIQGFMLALLLSVFALIMVMAMPARERKPFKW